jgi:hypothetical protein
LPNIAVKLSFLKDQPEATVTSLFGNPKPENVVSDDGDPLRRIGDSVPRQVVEPWLSIDQIVGPDGKLLQPLDVTIIDLGQGEYPIIMHLHIHSSGNFG